MKRFNWDNEKNKKLIKERGISFEEIVFCIEKGYILDKIEHPNQEKYEAQKMFIIRVDKYAYLVPFVEDEKEVFLKTIIPSRNATKLYIKGDD